ncbi:MAG: hypothetical protein HGA23_02945 [Bacteroidales bacterium]|nr:hypothetical protein [Bacteroidales bacterium]
MKNSLIILFIVFLLISCSKEKHTDEAAVKMQDFVVDISAYCRSFDQDFIIIPQNGVELAYLGTDPGQGLNDAYLAAIDGLGNEELFYNGPLAVDEERLDMLRDLKQTKKIMVADYVTDDSDIPDAISRNQNEGFICFPRKGDNYDYSQVPDSVIHGNSLDINTLEQAENYLYLISTDDFSSRQEMMNKLISTDFDLLLIDLFFEDTALSSSEIQQLKLKANGAERLLIAYINIGSAETFRYYWQDDWRLHHPSWIKKKYEGYEDEFWVEFWNKEWQDIIFGNDNSYLKKIIDADFDGAYLDNVEGYYFLYND